MSINNQILVKKWRGRFYVFDVMAESWGEWKNNEPVSKKNYLDVSRALGVFDTLDEAHEFAHQKDSEEPLSAEYGVVDEVLYKDGKPVILTNKPKGK